MRGPNRSISEYFFFSPIPTHWDVMHLSSCQLRTWISLGMLAMNGSPGIQTVLSEYPIMIPYLRPYLPADSFVGSAYTYLQNFVDRIDRDGYPTKSSQTSCICNHLQKNIKENPTRRNDQSGKLKNMQITIFNLSA